MQVVGETSVEKGASVCVCVCGKEGTRCSCALKYIADGEVLSSSLSAELSSEPQARSFRR